MNNQLHVFVNRDRVGVLERLHRTGEPESYRFTYRPGVPENHMVALTLPVREKPYFYHRLPPVFDQNLPEGNRRRLLNGLAKTRRMDDFGLLEVVGRWQVGRVRLSSDENLEETAPRFDLSALDREGFNYFWSIFNSSGATEGVSGMQAKLLRKCEVSKSDTISPHLAICVPGGEYVIKGFDPNEWDRDAENEHFCLLINRRAGIVTPETTLAAEGDLLFSKRFDISASGNYLGFDEACTLLKRRADEKYEGSIEDLIVLINEYVAQEHIGSDRETLFKAIVLDHLLRNSDAHLKNFGFLYTRRGDVRLSPIYDVTCTSVHLRMMLGIPELAMNGKQIWMRERSEFSDIGRTVFGLSSRRVKTLLDECCTAVAETLPDIEERVREQPKFEEIGRGMCKIFESSLSKISEPAVQGFSETDEPVQQTLSPGD